MWVPMATEHAPAYFIFPSRLSYFSCSPFSFSLSFARSARLLGEGATAFFFIEVLWIHRDLDTLATHQTHHELVSAFSFLMRSKHMRRREESRGLCGNCMFLYHHFGIYKGLPKAAGSWVERKRKREGGGGRVFLQVFSSYPGYRPLEARKCLSKLFDRRSGLRCSYCHGQADFTEWTGHPPLSSRLTFRTFCSLAS